jgi:hypothetical protein
MTRKNRTINVTKLMQADDFYGARSDAFVVCKEARNTFFSFGGWPKGMQHRLETGGPMVDGPQMYLAGRATVICGHGRGTGYDIEQAKSEGRYFEVVPGDTLVWGKARFTVALNSDGYNLKVTRK